MKINLFLAIVVLGACAGALKGADRGEVEKKSKSCSHALSKLNLNVEQRLRPREQRVVGAWRAMPGNKQVQAARELEKPCDRNGQGGMLELYKKTIQQRIDAQSFSELEMLCCYINPWTIDAGFNRACALVVSVRQIWGDHTANKVLSCIVESVRSKARTAYCKKYPIRVGNMLLFATRLQQEVGGKNSNDFALL